ARRRTSRPRARGARQMTAPKDAASESARPASGGSAPPSVSFEQSMERLTHIVEKLEEGDLPLEQSLALFEEGVRLSRLAQEPLDAPQQRIEPLLTVDAQARSRPAPSKSTKDEKDPP